MSGLSLHQATVADAANLAAEVKRLRDENAALRANLDRAESLIDTCLTALRQWSESQKTIEGSENA